MDGPSIDERTRCVMTIIPLFANTIYQYNQYQISMVASNGCEYMLCIHTLKPFIFTYLARFDIELIKITLIYNQIINPVPRVIGNNSVYTLHFTSIPTATAITV